MPFRERSPVEGRIALFNDYDTGVFTVSELCRRHGVSRETFYVWKRRRDAGAQDWYEAGSHRPAGCPHRTPAALAAATIRVRERFPHFGPKKIRAWLARERADAIWPAASTIGDILKREGLITARARRRRPPAQGEMAAPARAPNEEWAIDFKGWFRTRDGTRCDPLTVSDQMSRYLIAARIVNPSSAGVKCALERVFCEVGLPEAIRCDNGSPFGATGAGGLSRLSVWWLKLGVAPRYIPPASPQDNGRHERMHKTLKALTARPPAQTAREQQARFDAFRAHFNSERPHEALGQTVPAASWQPSRRQLPTRFEDPWYDADHEIRRVRPDGRIKWRNELVFVGEVLSGELVGIAEHESGAHIVRFCHRELGIIERAGRFRSFAPPRARLRAAAEAAHDTGTECE